MLEQPNRSVSSANKVWVMEIEVLGMHTPFQRPRVSCLLTNLLKAYAMVMKRKGDSGLPCLTP